MADIQSKILSKYGIDIDKENILKLYKVEKPDITDQELQTLIAAARKRWNQSINGANEKNAERDRARLEKADKYEAILKDAKMRKEVFDYYQKGGSSEKSSGGGSSAPSGSVEFAREYFKLVESTKKLRKQDVDFFFDYYRAQRKNKKAIIEMLGKEFKIPGLGKGKDSEGDEEEPEVEGKKKSDSSPLIVNLFQKATIIKLGKCAELYAQAIQSAAVCQRYPALKDGLYYFMKLDGVETSQQFTERVSELSKEIYNVRQEHGADYIPLVDLFNVLRELSDYRDVVDNIPAFKLLLKYPTLTPYMYAFSEMKPGTLKDFMNVANRDYSFRDETDFVLSYFKEVYDNFGISATAIGSILRKAEKKTKQNKVLNEIDKKLGRDKRRKVPIAVEIIHWLVYWPIFAVYFVFEVFKLAFDLLTKLPIPAGIVLFIASNIFYPDALDMENLLFLRYIFVKDRWYEFLEGFAGSPVANWFEAFLLTVIVIILMLAIYVAPPLILTYFLSCFCEEMNKRFDWVGYHRTFKNILQHLRANTEAQYTAMPKLFISKKIPKVIANFVNLALLIAILIFTPIGFRAFSEKTGYFQPKESSRHERYEETDEEDEDDEDEMTYEETEEDYPDDVIMVITGKKTSNLRSGPSVDYDVVATAEKGDTFVATGNEEVAANGRTWYEVYLDDERWETGWASETVIGFQD